MALDAKLNIQSRRGLGGDCQAYNSVLIASEMRFLLESACCAHYQTFSDAGRGSSKAVEDVFNLGTIGSSRVTGMEDHVGGLAVKKLADVLVFDTLSPVMVYASQMVLLSCTVNLETLR